MKNTKKNIYKISLLAVFLMLIVSGFTSKSIFDSRKYNESVVFNKALESGLNGMENGYNPVTGPLYINVPPTGFVNTAFTITVHGDSSYYLGNNIVTISATPSGNMNGTFVVNAVNGVATFNNISFNAAGPYIITASDGANTATGNIVIYPTPVPTKLVITNISVCDSSGNKLVNSLFNVRVQARDNNNFPANITGGDMLVLLSLASGSGLAGNTSGTILNGTNEITIYGVKIITIQSGVIVQASGGSLTPGLSNAFNIVSGPDHMVFENLPLTGTANFPLQSFKVTYFNSDNTPALCFGGTVTLTQSSPVSPIFLTGGTVATSFNGSATFYNVMFSMPGTYQLTASSPNFSPITSGNISISPGTPAITSTILPLNMQGNSFNLGHTPFVFLAKISFLTPTTIYRYYNRVVDANTPGTGDGVGNVIFANPTGSFSRTTTPDFITAGNYAEFTTDVTGSYTGWFISEATGDAVFTTPGNTVKMRITLSDGNTGPLRLTTTETVKIRDYDFSLSSSVKCQFIDQTVFTSGSALLPKNFLLFYTPIPADSSHLEYSRPVTGALIESDGLSLPRPPYNTNYNNIDGYAQRWGTILPCDLANGITRIEERNSIGNLSANPLTLINGSVRNVAYSSNGVWSPGVDTKNVPGGNAVLSIQPIFIPVGVTQIGIQVPSEFKLAQNYPNPFNPTTKIKFEISKASFVKLNIYDALGREVSSLVNEKLSPGTYSVELNASNMPSGVYFYKITAGDYTSTKRMVLLK